MAIVEPTGQNAESLRHLNKAGVTKIAYQSIIELSPWQEEYSALQREDFLNNSGAPLKNPRFGTFLANPSSTKWKELVLSKASELLNEKGYDGIFMDTAGDVETELVPLPFRLEAIIATAGIILELRKRFPRKILIQNNGLSELIKLTGDVIDGVVWENPDFSDMRWGEWNYNTINYLNYLKQEKKLKVMLLLEQGVGTNRIRSARNVAEKHGYLFHEGKNNYL
jgi:hypothetical protein